jgi:hypothetical protein
MSRCYFFFLVGFDFFVGFLFFAISIPPCKEISSAGTIREPAPHAHFRYAAKPFATGKIRFFENFPKKHKGCRGATAEFLFAFDDNHHNNTHRRARRTPNIRPNGDSR